MIPIKTKEGSSLLIAACAAAIVALMMALLSAVWLSLIHI